MVEGSRKTPSSDRVALDTASEEARASERPVVVFRTLPDAAEALGLTDRVLLAACTPEDAEAVSRCTADAAAVRWDTRALGCAPLARG